MSKPHLVTIFADTQRRAAAMANVHTERHVYSEIEADAKADAKTPTEFKVVNQDTLEAAQDMLNAGSDRVCVLNMASAWQPGGGVKRGCTAQEEEICRRTNLYRSISAQQYPLSEYTVMKDADYQLLKQPFQIDIVSVAAIRHPELHQGRLSPRDWKKPMSKVRIMLRTLLAHGVQDVVLGAFGCGTYRNPPEVVSRIFRLLLTKEFNNQFRRVTFTILCRKDTTNYDIFHAEFASLN